MALSSRNLASTIFCLASHSFLRLERKVLKSEKSKNQNADVRLFINNKNYPTFQLSYYGKFLLVGTIRALRLRKMCLSLFLEEI